MTVLGRLLPPRLQLAAIWTSPQRPRISFVVQVPRLHRLLPRTHLRHAVLSVVAAIASVEHVAESTRCAHHVPLEMEPAILSSRLATLKQAAPPPRRQRGQRPRLLLQPHLRAVALAFTRPL
jgi:hypothetical protein